MTESSKEKEKKITDFVDKVMKLYREDFGEGNLENQFIIHMSHKDSDGLIAAIGGHGCPMCALIELNTYAVMNNMKHNGEEDNAPPILQGEIPSNLMN